MLLLFVIICYYYPSNLKRPIYIFFVKQYFDSQAFPAISGNICLFMKLNQFL